MKVKIDDKILKYLIACEHMARYALSDLNMAERIKEDLHLSYIRFVSFSQGERAEMSEIAFTTAYHD